MDLPYTRSTVMSVLSALLVLGGYAVLGASGSPLQALQQDEAATPSAPLPTGAVYLQCEEGGGTVGKGDKGDWLSFSSLDMKMYAPDNLKGRAPFLLIPAQGTPGGFSLQNLWDGYTESRYGYFISVTGDGALVLVPEANTAGRAVFTAVPVGGGDGAVYLDYVRSGKPDAEKGWVGPTPSGDVELVVAAGRASWSFVAAPDALLPPSGPPAFFQVASGTHKNDWVGFSGTTVCCGACAGSEGQRGIWGLIPSGVNASAASDPENQEYYIMNLWRAPSEPRVGMWLGVSGTKVILSPKAELAQRVAWRLVPNAASTATSPFGGSFYLQDTASGSFIGLTSSEVVAMVPLASRVAFASVVAPPPPPPPAPPAPPCGYNSYPDCVCPHLPSGSPPPCSAPTPPPCRAADTCDLAAFIGYDNKTQGAFKDGGYGSAGQYFPGMAPTSSSQNLPSFVASITVSGESSRTGEWYPPSTASDPRAVSADGADIFRSLTFAATASPNASNAFFDITILLKDKSSAQPYQLALYAVDFAGDGCSCSEPPMCCRVLGVPPASCSKPAKSGRMQSIEVLHASTNASAAPMQVLSEFGEGVYARYHLSGDVRIRVAEVCAQRGDAMLNALFFDQ